VLARFNCFFQRIQCRFRRETRTRSFEVLSIQGGAHPRKAKNQCQTPDFTQGIWFLVIFPFFFNFLGIKDFLKNIL
jgi:hypothetical protein